MKNKNVLHKLLFALIFVAKVFLANGQDIRTNVIEYLIKVGDLKSIYDTRQYYDNIFIVDLLNHENAFNKKKGILKFGTYSDHSRTYLLLKDDSVCDMLDIQILDEVLIKEIAFLKKNKRVPDEIIRYVEATIFEYQKNQKVIPWTE